jgi:haloacetate dehalogenase
VRREICQGVVALFFFDQKDKPERAILADPLVWYGDSPEKMGNANFEDFRATIHDPQTVHGMIEDYRAGLKIDRVHDQEDRNAGRKITCPVQVLWSQHDDLEIL